MLNINRKKFNIVLYSFFFIFLIMIIAFKQNYHIDEFFSYHLANHQGISGLNIQEKILYEPSNLPFLEYLTVNSNNRFDFINVWNNQINDVHPPLYYLLLHLNSSFIPGQFSKWSSAIINIICALLMLYFSQKIIDLLTDNEDLYRVVSIMFIFTTGILDDVAFFRMYMLAMLWVTISVYLFLKKIDDENFVFYPYIGIVTYLGAITHYYCIIFSVLISVVYGIYLLIKKDYKNVMYFCLTMFIAGTVSYLTFPSMISHIFSGYRGTEATDNLFNFEDYSLRFIKFFDNISNELFGNYLQYFLLLLLCLLVIVLIQKKINNRKLVFKYLLIFIPAFLYFFLVVKIAAYINERYISHIYAILIIGLYCLMFTLIKKIIDNKYSKYLICSISIIYIFFGFYHAEWTYLYRETKEVVDNSKTYSNLDAILITDNQNFDVLYNSVELMNYNSLTMYENINDIVIDSNKNEIIIKIINISEEGIMNDILVKYPQFKEYELLGEARKGKTYLLH